MSSPDPKGTEAVTFKIPTLGHAVCLGELYDQRSGTFLGVQLYPQDKIIETETDIRHTDLSLSLSTSLEDKASLLDISAKLSLEVACGLVKVSGSASYFNDAKSNTEEHAFALALKMRLCERRILFAEAELGRNVLEVAQEDYIATKKATHFVSAIVYGGNFIVNLVAKKSRVSREEAVGGKLEAEFNDLKGAISLEGEVDAKIKGEFESMNDNFDLVIHGDVALDSVPINPQDVLDTFPDAASLITVGGGVPISVTLQPIPQKLLTGSLVYQLDADAVDKILQAYSLLDDLDSRFSVLTERIKLVREFVPKLARAICDAATEYAEEHGERLHELRKFLYNYQHGTGPDPDSDFGTDDGNGGTCGIGDKVLKAARDLYNSQLDPDRRNNPGDEYPASLAGLEDEHSKFQYFVADIERLQKSLEPPTDSDEEDQEQSNIRLSTIEDICRAARVQSMIPLFVMTPLAPASDESSDTDDDDGSLSPDAPNPDLAVIQFLAIVRNYAAYFMDSNPGYIVYAENLKRLERRLPNNGQFSGLTCPSLFIGQVDVKGKLTWSAPPETLERSLKLDHKPSNNKLGNLTYSVDPVDGTRSFSLFIHAKSPSTPSKAQVMCVVQRVKNNASFLQFQTPLEVELQRYQNDDAAVINSTTTPSSSTTFTATFVQDIDACKWILYLGDTQVKQVLFTSRELLDDCDDLQIAYPDGVTWWNGEVYEVKAFTYALNKDQVAAEAQKATASTG